MEIVEYETESGESPFGDWFNSLHAPAAAKVTLALIRLGQGNTSNVESVGAGIHEFKIDFGPGYRIYFGYDGKELVVLVAGGSKKRQARDIETAKAHWQNYKQRKRFSGV
jgi:putative addiction module killer protein